MYKIFVVLAGVILLQGKLLGEITLEPGFSTQEAVNIIHAKLYQTIPLPDRQNAEVSERRIQSWLQNVRQKPITRKQFCQICDRAFNPRLSQSHRDRDAEAKHAVLSKVAENFIVEFVQQAFPDSALPEDTALRELRAGRIECFRKMFGGFHPEFARITGGFQQKSKDLYSSEPLLTLEKSNSIEELMSLMQAARVFAAYEEVFALLVFLDVLSVLIDMKDLVDWEKVSSWDFQEHLTVDNASEHYVKGLQRVATLLPEHRKWKVGPNVTEADVMLRYARQMLSSDLDSGLKGEKFKDKTDRNVYVFKLLKISMQDPKLRGCAFDIYMSALQNGALGVGLDGRPIADFDSFIKGVYQMFPNEASEELTESLSMWKPPEEAEDGASEEEEVGDVMPFDEEVSGVGEEDRVLPSVEKEQNRDAASVLRESISECRRLEQRTRKQIEDSYHKGLQSLRSVSKSDIKVLKHRELCVRSNCIPKELKKPKTHFKDCEVKFIGLEQLSAEQQDLVKGRLKSDILAGRSPRDSVTCRKSLPHLSFVVPKNRTIYELFISNKPEMWRLYYYYDKESKTIVAMVGPHLKQRKR